jgi:hypothetical protein
MSAPVHHTLGQVKPLIATLTDLYEVGDNRSAIVSIISVCNQDVATTSFRISIAPNGAPDAVSQYLYYGYEIDGNDTQLIAMRLPLTTRDTIRVYAAAATLSFGCYGIEYS